MNFEGFLKQLGITEASYNNFTKEERDVVQASFFRSRQNEFSAEEREKQNQVQAAQAKREAQMEKDRARQQAWYDQWDNYFNTYTGNLSSKRYASNSERVSKDQLKKTEARRMAALKVARKNCKGHPENLLFAEADALEDSLKLESWERCIPLGKEFERAIKYGLSTLKPDEKLSQNVKKYLPGNVDYALYSRLLVRFDDENLSGDNASEIARNVFKNNKDSLAFYEAHRDDEMEYANPDNLDFTMKEMFRLRKRMARNPSMSGPMKELNAKLKSLEKDYTKDPEKYRNMPRGRLNHLMTSVMMSADAYVNDKKDLTSYSSTQLERLKCINQLKTLHEAFIPNASQEKFAYGLENVNPVEQDSSYIERAVAEKLVLAARVNAKNGKSLCNRDSIEKGIFDLLSNDLNITKTDYHEYLKTIVDVVRKEKGKDYPQDKIYDKILKTNGQKLLERCRKFFDARDKERIAKGPRQYPGNDKPVKNQGGMGMH